MSDVQRTADIERLMQLLMHDLRSPLGVAQGYVSLLGGDQLSADDRVRALRGVTDAIARISRLVDDVAAMLAPVEMVGGQTPVEISLLCERVAAEAERRGIRVTSGEFCPGAKVRVGASLDGLAEAIAIVLSPAGGELRVMPGQNTYPETEPALEAFDPETIGTVEHLKAHQHIAMLQGRVWRKVGETRAYRVTLPSEPMTK